MNDLIKINRNGDEATVSGRELHKALEVETPYHKWFPRMCEYGFVENEDYSVMDIFVHNSKGGKQSYIDHQLTLDMAKEVCMIQRTPQGRKFRKYFIDVEKAYRNNCFNYQQLADRVERLEKLLSQQAQSVQPKPMISQQPKTLPTPTNRRGRTYQSKIAKLPIEVRVTVEYMLLDSHYIYDDIINYLFTEYGIKVGKATLSRYYQKLTED